MSCDLNAFLEETVKIDNPGYKKVICKDGLCFSVKADQDANCMPKLNFGPYKKVEVAYPSFAVEEFLPYAFNKEFPTCTVYNFVPVKIVEKVIQDHGGIRNKKRKRSS